ncbi:MAG: hypothetical protein RMK29_16535 [Myxococcales bacterium]|nr:hypothetical protein [Myxococcales bacterium]
MGCLSLVLTGWLAACAPQEPRSSPTAPVVPPSEPPADEPLPAVVSPWRFEHPLPQGNTLHGVWVGAGEAWAVGERGTVVRLRPEGAEQQAQGATLTTLRAVVSEGQRLWAVGDGGILLRGEGGRFAAYRIAQDDLLTIWLEGTGPACAGKGNQWFRFDGRRFVSGTLPVLGPADAVRGAAARGTDLYLVGTSGRILHRTPHGWFLEGDGLTSLDLVSVALLEDGTVYAGGAGGRILRRDPRTQLWSVDHPRGSLLWTRAEVRAVFSVAGSVLAVTSDGVVLRRGETDWAVEASGLGHLRAGAAGGAGALVVGDGGVVLRREAGAWRPPAGLARLGAMALLGVASDGAVAYAVADDGSVLRRQDRDVPLRWVLDHAPGPLAQPLYAIGARDGEAWAAGSGGVLLRRTPQGWQPEPYMWPDRRPDWRGIAVLPGGEVFVVGGAVTPEADAEAAILHRTAGVWVRERPIPRVTSALQAVASDGRHVLAVGTAGTILRREGMSWIVEDSDVADDVQLFALTVVDGLFYAAGTGGAVLRREVSMGRPRWVREQIAGAGSLLALAAVGPELWAVGAGGIAAVARGGSWAVEPTLSASHLAGVAVLPHGLLAVGSGGTVLVRSLAR